MAENQVYGVILAGGSGERFWPLSRKSQPKQLLKIHGQKTVLEEAVKRLAPLIPKKRMFICTGKGIAPQLKKILPKNNFIVEPLARNTAACIGLSALYIEKLDPEGIMLIETADHVYNNPQAFLEHLKLAINQAREYQLVTLGIKPTRPETGFGYIEKGDPVAKKIFEVDDFVEKPDLKTAQEFLSSKNFLWNSGIFVCKCQRMLKAIKEHMPKLYLGLKRIKQSNFDEKVIEQVFQGLKSISIDYGVMEKENNIRVVEGDFHWDDIGDWRAMERILKKDDSGNVIKGQSLLVNSENNIVFSDKLVALVGLKNMVVIDTQDALLVCPKDQAQKVRDVTRKLAQKKEWEKYLD
jgi:mannose-1-phosphate guanylyltransferase